MKKYGLGLVVGKFSPPHRGHKHLIDTALASSERVIVLVTDTPGPHLPVALRAEWVREIHPAAEVRAIADICKDDDSPAWGEYVIGLLGRAPDAVFSSENYGPPFAAAMGCVHVAVDPPRQTFPVSGTLVRQDPYRQWDFLEPCVRAHFVKRVSLVGAESTGTTTLARALAERYRTVWAPEYGRFYADGKYASGRPEWRSEEFTHIAEQQLRLMASLARVADRVVFSDTDPFATAIWHERYLGAPAPEVRALAAAHRPDLYLLTGDEIPFETDPLRDGEHQRHWMHARFEEELRHAGVPYAILRGPHEKRLAEAVRLVDELFAKNPAVGRVSLECKV